MTDDLPEAWRVEVEIHQPEDYVEAKAWVPYQGPQGGEGWQDTSTGDVIYDDEPPGEAVGKELLDASADDIQEAVAKIFDEESAQSLEGLSEEEMRLAVQSEASADELADVADAIGSEAESSNTLEGEVLQPTEWDQLEIGDVIEGQMGEYSPVRGEITDLNASSGQFAEGDKVIAVETDMGIQKIGSESHGTVEVIESDQTTEESDESTDSIVPEPPADIEESWNEKQQYSIKRQAAKHDMKPDEFREEVADEYSRVMDAAKPAIRVSSKDILEQVLESGRFKSQFETGTSSGWLDNSLRSDFENSVLGVDADISDEKRPIYGYASTEDASIEDDPQDADHYGSIAVKLNDSKKKESTVTFADSLSSNRSYIESDRGAISSVPTNADNPSEKSVDLGAPARFGDTKLEELQQADDPTDLAMFNEFQMHGQVTTDDIDKVVMPPDQSDLDAITEMLDEHNIDYEVKA